jgi:ferredoxin--NADP+ reductase
MPFPIISSERLSETVGAVRVSAPDIARNARAGQFAILRIDETGERFPLTLCDWSAEEGWIYLVFQEVGKSTYQLGRLRQGDALTDLVGPLGIPSDIAEFGRVLCVGGGVGIAAIHPICRALSEAGNHVVSILGARTSELIILEEEMQAVSDEVIITTDDGSKGHKGVVTWVMEEELKKGGIGMVLAIGPAVMMKFASAVTKPFNVPTRVSLNSIMLDGTGMCGTCRCEVEGKTRFACVDGPEFDGHQVDWGLLLTRLAVYKEEEKASLDRYLSR